MGGRAAAGRPVAAGSRTGQSYLAGQRKGRDERERGSQTWDPDDPWSVEHGVPPVLEPAEEPSFHDPGPGVIGIDR